jgi:hypothetical protein
LGKKLLKTYDLLEKIGKLKQQMWDRLCKENVKVDFDSYEKIYDTYLDKFGRDHIVKMYDSVNLSLSDCPIMID